VYGLRNKIIAYVIDKGSNLNTLITALKSIIKCKTLGLEESFQGPSYGHVFSKVYPYAKIDETIYKSFKYVSIKSTQTDLQKWIPCPKKSSKCHQEWNKTCIEVVLKPRKLNTLVKIMLVLF